MAGKGFEKIVNNLKRSKEIKIRAGISRSLGSDKKKQNKFISPLHYDIFI